MTGPSAHAPIALDGAPDWRHCSKAWPNSEASQFWSVDGFSWHVQRLGAGPQVLLLHGSGSSTHSWRKLVDALKADFEIIAVDLPGHGFSQSPANFKPSLPNVARALGRLLAQMESQPEAIIGHSAGAAIAITMVDLGVVSPKILVSLNGALQPFAGPMSVAAPLMAKLAAVSGAPAWFISKGAINSRRVRNLIEETGSKATDVDAHLYGTLLGYPGHIRGTLAMMANWELSGVTSACARLNVPVLYLSADRDRTIRPSVAAKACAVTKQGSHECLHQLGHLAHEENGDIVAKIILSHWAVHAGKRAE